MNHDLLLTWASERGAGTWNEFLEVHEWLSSGSDGVAGSRASATVRTLSMLGHLEMDWSARRWGVAPSVATMLPDAGGYAVLTGSRTRRLMKRLNQIIDTKQTLFIEPRGHPEAPSTIFIGCEEESDVAWLADTLGIAFVTSVSEELSEVLPPLLAYLRAAPQTRAPRGAEGQRFNPDQLRTPQPRRGTGAMGPGPSANGPLWSDVEEHDEAGLYRFKVYGHPEYRWISGGGASYEVDFALGAYLELSRCGVDVLEWTRDGGSGVLRCPDDGAAPLPTLHARAAALCTGLAPARDGRRLTFFNVPERIARRIATSLSQQLRCTEAPAVQGVPVVPGERPSETRLRPALDPRRWRTR